MAGNFYPSRGNAIIVDDDENVYTTGSFGNTTDFDPCPGLFNLTANDADEGYQDIYISKLNSEGDFVWAKSIGNSYIDKGRAIALDGANNVYVTGQFRYNTDFDPGPDQFLLPGPGFSNSFVLKLSSEGDFIWAKGISGSQTHTWGEDIAIDKAGNVYTTGMFEGTVDFDPGLNTFNFSSTQFDHRSDIFISKLNSEGDFVWARSFGGGWSDWGEAITLDQDTNLYVTGEFRFTIDFDPGPDTFNLTSSGTKNAFILKLDKNGDFIWAGSLIGNENGTSYGYSNAIDNSGNLYTTGIFSHTIDFDPGSNVYELIGGGMFIHKMRQQPDPVIIEEVLDEFSSKSYSIFPNPTESILNIHFEDHRTFEISLIDVLGRTVILEKHYTKQAEIDVNQLPAGNYWLKITNKEAIFWEQVQILH